MRTNTRALIWVGRNCENRGKASSKIYLIAARGSTVYRKYGKVDVVRGRAIPVYLQQRRSKFESASEACDFVRAMIHEKLDSGYDICPTSMRPRDSAFF